MDGREDRADRANQADGCYADDRAVVTASVAAKAGLEGPVSGPPYADCVLCGEPTEYGTAHPGATLCPVCEWQEAQRTACSG
ncbi:hypothetical protein [Streptomyces sp. 8N616]|uniref:hypothetical protein n=1 Tax=Streptomyces sp. 8N616 TaxID=3457414 RepID=UPI003FD6033F